MIIGAPCARAFMGSHLLNFNKGFTAKSSAILKVLFNEEIATKIARTIPILLNSTFR